MSSRHEGVSCDSCNKNNFKGKRYKCLICFDYDLCSSCFEVGTTTTRHTSDHPMQCIMTRPDFDLFYGGESLQFDHPSSYSFICPYCGKLGLSENQLQDHLSNEHSPVNIEVICPICAALPGGDPNHVTDNLANHLAIEHRPSARDPLEEPISRNIRRIFHPAPPRSRRGQPSTGASSSTSGVASNMAPVLASNRDSVDPIAELLSQLSGVRRAAQQQPATTTASQLQLLQQQLQFERQQVQSARERLERLPRKQPSPPTQTNTIKAKQTSQTSDASGKSDNYLLDMMFKEERDNIDLAAQERDDQVRTSFVQDIFYTLIQPEIKLAIEQWRMGSPTADDQLQQGDADANEADDSRSDGEFESATAKNSGKDFAGKHGATQRESEDGDAKESKYRDGVLHFQGMHLDEDGSSSSMFGSGSGDSSSSLQQHAESLPNHAAEATAQASAVKVRTQYSSSASDLDANDSTTSEQQNNNGLADPSGISNGINDGGGVQMPRIS